MPIENLGPSDPSARTLGAELHKTGATERTALGTTPPRTANEPAPGDRVELSVAARALSAGDDPETAARRLAHTAEMKRAIEDGTLVNPERLARAAERLLGE
jgi:anti-sigma28 factor (negative regulator of flagellin synthesis)